MLSDKELVLNAATLIYLERCPSIETVRHEFYNNMNHAAMNSAVKDAIKLYQKTKNALRVDDTEND